MQMACYLAGNEPKLQQMLAVVYRDTINSRRRRVFFADETDTTTILRRVCLASTCTVGSKRFKRR